MELNEVKILPEIDQQANQRFRVSFMRKHKTSDPNYFDATDNKTVFEKILRTPDSAKEIKWCIKNGANLYNVSFKKIDTNIKLIDKILRFL